MAENELLAAYRSIPIVTRSILTATILLSLAPAFGILSYQLLFLSWPHVIYRFQLHRLLTPFFVKGLDFNMLFDLYFLYTYGIQLETTTFAGRSADFAWFILFTSIISTIGGHFLNLVMLSQSLLLAVIYLWAQSNSERIVSFMFGFQFKAIYFPWVLIAYSFVISRAVVPWDMIVGIASAHLYYFLNHVYPGMGGPRLIPTPTLLYKLLPRQEVAGATFASNGETANMYRVNTAGGSGSGGGHQWGRGHRLG
ncbi:hypothetical protein BX616_010666 [Lobosporangium transversale]|uniref:Derlin n=1 Tax=Lobosporangium transversale TaxID=64571 RepID=A0A1Y2H0A5_9FUNG|nr:Der1-like family-domain-containing protein [Lobosporangium transversale]KAF9911155.1 hypothetical protein BX616_010666 [Lobosporangium transversale]ORZ27990.1 Der1-like family-domain-containing protein [Lobosporangium transversale]|eukprot:XP_021885693.1 Der1-like family-domain-containing protein [Lobosporangium transversale]